MTKQEEIREGLEGILKDTGHFFPYASATEEIINYLHSQGVVIKVDNGRDLTGCCIARIEPLIDEKAD